MIPLPSSISYTQRELVSLNQLLHLAHHRNRNQHRLSKWYKSLSTFRRQIAKLLLEVKELDIAIEFSVENRKKDGRKEGGQGKEGKYVRMAREKVEGRVAFWEERLVGRWFV